MPAPQPYGVGDGFEYAACWEQQDGGTAPRWWPHRQGGFNSIAEALEWPATLACEVKNVRVIRRPTGEWEQVYPEGKKP